MQLAIQNGAAFDQTVENTMIGLGVGVATGGLGQSLGLGQLGGLLLGTASAAVTTGISNVASGSSFFGYDMLGAAFLSAAQGAATLGLTELVKVSDAAIARAYNAGPNGAQGEGGSGESVAEARATAQAAGAAAHDASEAASSHGGSARAVVGQSGGDGGDRLLVAEDYDEGQTKQILHQGVAELRSRWVGAAAYDMLANTAGGKWDFKVTQPTDTFTVDGQRLDAGKFGNYFISYVGTARFGDLGMFGAAAGGELYNMGGFVIGQDPTFFDSVQDQLLIIGGAADATRDFGLRQLSCPVCSGGVP